MRGASFYPSHPARDGFRFRYPPFGLAFRGVFAPPPEGLADPPLGATPDVLGRDTLGRDTLEPGARLPRGAAVRPPLGRLPTVGRLGGAEDLPALGRVVPYEGRPELGRAGDERTIPEPLGTAARPPTLGGRLPGIVCERGRFVMGVLDLLDPGDAGARLGLRTLARGDVL